MVCSDTSAVQSIVTMKQDEDKLVPVDSHKLFAISGEAGDRVNFSEFIIANVRAGWRSALLPRGQSGSMPASEAVLRGCAVLDGAGCCQCQALPPPRRQPPTPCMLRACPPARPQVRLYALRNGAQLSTKAVANFTRGELATALRKVGGPRWAGWGRGGWQRGASAVGARRVPTSPAPHTSPSLLSVTSQSPYQTNLLMAGYDEGSGPALYWCDYLATLHAMNICGTGYGVRRGACWWMGGA